MKKRKLVIFDFDDLIYRSGKDFKDLKVPACYLVYKKLFKRLSASYRLCILSKEHTSSAYLWLKENGVIKYFEAPVRQRRKCEIYLNKDNINLFIRSL